MLITSIVKEEYNRNCKMIAEYENLMKGLPKGTLIVRNGYYYLKYRDGAKIYDKYIGKDEEAVSILREKLYLRKHYMELLVKLREESKAIQKILEGLE